MRTLCSGLLGAALFVTACSSDDPTPSTPSTPDAGFADSGDAPELTYFRDFKPILDARCVSCHSQGNIAPIDLTVPMLAQSTAALLKQQVVDRIMPPWHAKDDCQTYQSNRSLSDAQIDTIARWADIGAPLGDPATEGEPLPALEQGLSRVDLRVQTGQPYTPRLGEDYRCLLVEWPENETKFVTGFNLEPTNPAIVHHANLYLVDETAVQEFRDRDAADPGLGYACFGGAFGTGVSLLGAWAPGSVGIEYPAGTGIQINPGMIIVMEMHYDTDQSRQGEDQAAIALQLTDQVDRRALIAPFWDFAVWSRGGMPIPADNPDVMHAYELDAQAALPLLAPWLTSTSLRIWGAGLHMHFLGETAKIDIRRGDGTDECLLEIPRWDFNWQYGYLLESPIDFISGFDSLYLECRWDNTVGNQPIINGQRQPVQARNWGGGSDDEMCIGYVYVTER